MKDYVMGLEPEGADLRALLGVVGDCTATISLSLPPEGECKSSLERITSLFGELGVVLAARERCGARQMEATPACRAVEALASVSSRLFDWQCPPLLDGLSARREDGSILFEVIGHEYDARLSLTVEEADEFLRALPNPLYLIPVELTSSALDLYPTCAGEWHEIRLHGPDEAFALLYVSTYVCTRMLVLETGRSSKEWTPPIAKLDADEARVWLEPARDLESSEWSADFDALPGDTHVREYSFNVRTMSHLIRGQRSASPYVADQANEVVLLRQDGRPWLVLDGTPGVRLNASDSALDLTVATTHRLAEWFVSRHNGLSW